VTVRRIRHQGDAELRYLADAGVRPEVELAVVDIAPFGMVTVETPAGEQSLPKEVAAAHRGRPGDRRERCRGVGLNIPPRGDPDRFDFCTERSPLSQIEPDLVPHSSPLFSTASGAYLRLRASTRPNASISMWTVL